MRKLDQLRRNIDQLRRNQWRRLLEIQKIQLDLMHELTERKRRPAPVPEPGATQRARD